MKGKHESLIVFFLFFFSFVRKTFSSFICWTEILKSFKFFATLFPSSFMRSRLLEATYWVQERNFSGPHGMQHVYEYTSRFLSLFFKKCCKTWCFRPRKWTAKFMKISTRIPTKWQSSNFWSIAEMTWNSKPNSSDNCWQNCSESILHSLLLCSMPQTKRQFKCISVIIFQSSRFAVSIHIERKVEKSPQFMVSKRSPPPSFFPSLALIYEIAKLSDWII